MNRLNFSGARYEVKLLCSIAEKFTKLEKIYQKVIFYCIIVSIWQINDKKH